jgi:hypothetical protein
MITLILKLGEDVVTIELKISDIAPFIEVLKTSIIIDTKGESWILDPDEQLYFDVKPPHFILDCKIHKP